MTSGSSGRPKVTVPPPPPGTRPRPRASAASSGAPIDAGEGPARRRTSTSSTRPPPASIRTGPAFTSAEELLADAGDAREVARDQSDHAGGAEARGEVAEGAAAPAHSHHGDAHEHDIANVGPYLRLEDAAALHGASDDSPHAHEPDGLGMFRGQSLDEHKCLTSPEEV